MSIDPKAGRMGKSSHHYWLPRLGVGMGGRSTQMGRLAKGRLSGQSVRPVAFVSLGRDW